MGYVIVFDSATGLAGLATKLMVLSRSRLSFTQPAKQAKPATFFCCSFEIHKTFQKGQKNHKWGLFPQKMFIMKYGLWTGCKVQ
jgi:hypothetical protein